MLRCRCRFVPNTVGKNDLSKKESSNLFACCFWYGWKKFEVWVLRFYVRFRDRQHFSHYLKVSRLSQIATIIFVKELFEQNGHLLSLLDPWQDRTTSKHFSTTVLYSDFVTLAYQRGQVKSSQGRIHNMILANNLSMKSTTITRTRNTATSSLSLIVLVVALLSSICDIVVVDASYAISIEPDSEECYIYTTHTDIGSTCIIT